MERKLLTTKEAAEFLGMSYQFLERDRWAGAIIPFVRIGRRSIRYELETLQEYIRENRMKSTSEY